MSKVIGRRKKNKSSSPLLPRYYTPERSDQDQVLSYLDESLEIGEEYLKYFGPFHLFGEDLKVLTKVLRTYRDILHSTRQP